ncbi:hypothetical protein V6Z11_A13G024300 [Gossypium hirsutum]
MTFRSFLLFLFSDVCVVRHVEEEPIRGVVAKACGG